MRFGERGPGGRECLHSPFLFCASPAGLTALPSRLLGWKQGRSMHSRWFGEFLGTLMLVLLGNGVNAGVTLRKSYAADAGWMVIATGWAIAVLCGVLVAQAFGSPGANLNPAITLAAAVTTGDFSQLLAFW